MNDTKSLESIFLIYLGQKTFRGFVLTCKFYDAEKVLNYIPKDMFLPETAHILSRVYRHAEALSIFVEKLKDIKSAEDYCEEHFKRDDPRSDSLFSTLFSLFRSVGLHDTSQIIEYLNKHGYRIEANEVCCC